MHTHSHIHLGAHSHPQNKTKKNLMCKHIKVTSATNGSTKGKALPVHLKYDLLCVLHNYYTGKLSPIGKKYSTN